MSKKRFSVKDTRLQDSIGALLQEQPFVGEGRQETLPIEMIQVAPENPRYVGRVNVEEIIAHREGHVNLNAELGARATFFMGVQDLANSIARRGLLQPIVVREDMDGFRVLAGERRLLAHVLLGRERIRAMVRPSGGELEERSIRLIENLQRENLSFAELIQGIDELDVIFQAEYGRSMDSIDLAAELHKHDSTCRRYLQVVRSPKDVRQAIETGKVTGLRPALALVEIESEEERRRLLQSVSSVDLTEDVIRRHPSSAPGIKPESLEKPLRKGRKRAQVSLGAMRDMDVMQRLMLNILGEELYSIRAASLDWNDFDAVQEAWDELLDELKRGSI